MAYQRNLKLFVKNSNENMTCSIVHSAQLTDGFRLISTGVRQGCLLFPFLFFLAIDWITRTLTEGRRNGMQHLVSLGSLIYLDFADNFALLFLIHQQMQEKTEVANYNSTQIGPYIHPTKQ